MKKYAPANIERLCELIEKFECGIIENRPVACEVCDDGVVLRFKRLGGEWELSTTRGDEWVPISSESVITRIAVVKMFPRLLSEIDARRKEIDRGVAEAIEVIEPLLDSMAVEAEAVHVQ